MYRKYDYIPDKSRKIFDNKPHKRANIFQQVII